MKLRWQILIIALFSFSFPIVLWVTFYQFTENYQKAQNKQIHQQLDIVTSSLNNFSQNHPRQLDGYILSNLDAPVLIDGLNNEWQLAHQYNFATKVKYQLASENNKLALLIRVNDETNYNDQDKEDKVIVLVGNDRGIHRFEYPRKKVSGYIDRDPQKTMENSYEAYWNEMENSYILELTIHIKDPIRLGIAVVDYNGSETTVWSTVDHSKQANDNIHLRPILKPVAKWQEFIQSITPQNSEISLYDHTHQRLYQHNRINANQTKQLNWLENWLYQSIFNQSSYGEISAEKAFDQGFIELKSMNSATHQSLITFFIRSLSIVLVLIVILIMLYLIYASVLVWRIKKLNRQLQTVLDSGGTLNTQLPSARANDEIGDLSRATSSMLEDIQQYTRYLKDLGSRLSHEMKTPLSIVQSSLDNLSFENKNDNVFLERATDGINRLRFILNQLSQLSQLKNSINNTEKKKIHLNDLIHQLALSYKSTEPRINYHIDETPIYILGSAELLAQLTDKLVENAIDFCTESDHINITLAHLSDSVKLSVKNTGPHIPEHQLKTIFDSLYSAREHKSKSAHLGIGLYIAKLIAEFHQAHIVANNLENPKAVEFSINWHNSQHITNK